MDTQIFDKVTEPKNKDSVTEAVTTDIPDTADISVNDEPVASALDIDEDNKRKTKKKEGASGFVASAFDCFSSIIVALAVVLVLMTFCVRLVNVDGISMLNTLEDNNKLIVSGLGYTPEVGDIVIISHGVSYDKTIVKRVIAVGGQTVDINDETGEVTVDGIVIDEPYTNGKTVKTGDTQFPVKVEEGTVFVLGDNRQNSNDSRCSEIGLIDNDWIIGKVCFRIWPLNEIGKVE